MDNTEASTINTAQEESAVAVTETPAPVQVPSSPIKVTPLLKILLILLGVLFVLVIVVFLFYPKSTHQQVSNLPSGAPSPVAPSSPVDRPLSEAAKTPEFQAFESKLNAAKAQQDQLDLTESQLTFPFLEMKVNYTK